MPATKAVRKTRQQIEKAIADLREMKSKVRHFSFFGDDNWAKIEAQIAVLEKDMGSDTINTEYGDDAELESAALEARYWMDGQEDEDLVESWKILVTK